MRAIRRFKLFESIANRQRLVDLGIIEDQSVADWVEALLEKDPDLSMVWHPNDMVFTVKRDSDRAKVLIRPGSQPGFTKEWVKIEYSEADGMRFWVKRREEIITWEGTNLTMAQKIVDRIKRYYAVQTSESLTRLADLGLAPELDICDWVLELLKGHPDFSVERGTGFANPTLLIGRNWAKSDIVIRLVGRVLNQDGATEVFKIALAYLDANGISSSRYSWTPDELRVGPGNLGIARGIVQLLDEYYSRKAVGIKQSTESTPNNPDFK